MESFLTGCLVKATTGFKAYCCGHVKEVAAAVAGCGVGVSAFAHGKHKRSRRLKKPLKGASAFDIEEAFRNAQQAEQRANGGKRRSLELHVDHFIVDSNGHITTRFRAVEVSASVSRQPPPKPKFTMTKFWSDKRPAPVADKDVMQDNTVDKFLGESRVNEDGITEEVGSDTTPGPICSFGTSTHGLSCHGFRDGSHLSVPWHAFTNSPELANMVFVEGRIHVCCLKTGMEKLCKVVGIKTHNKCPEKMNSLRGSGLDSVCIELDKDDWSVLGASSLCGSKKSNPFMSGYGYKLVCYAQDFNTKKVYRSEGHMIPDENLCKHGLVRHTCNTEPGWSGAPLWSIVNGRLMWSGMHIGNNNETDYNVGVSVSAYGHLRRIAGMVVKTPAVSMEMMASLQKTAELADRQTLQKMLDMYLSKVEDEVEEYDGLKLAPLVPEQLTPFVTEAIGSMVCSSDSVRSFQSALEEAQYERMARGQEEEDLIDQLTMTKRERRDAMDDMDVEEYRERLRMTQAQRANIDMEIRGEQNDEGAVYYDEEYRPSRRPGLGSLGSFPRASLRGKPWADFLDESIPAVKSVLLDTRVTPEMLRQAALYKEVHCDVALAARPMSTIAEGSSKSSDEQIPPGVVVATSDSGDKAEISGQEPISFSELKDKIDCQSLPVGEDKFIRDKLAKQALGFDHANYSGPHTVLTEESQVYYHNSKDKSSSGAIAGKLIKDVMLGKTPLSAVVTEIREFVDYSSLRESPFMADYWRMVDCTAERVDKDPQVLATREGLEAVTSDGHPMATVVAEISPTFKGGTTSQPQRFDDQVRDCIERMEKNFRKEASQSSDPEERNIPNNPPVKWDWALPPTSSAAVRQSLVSQLRRLEKGGFKDYPAIAAQIEKQWPSILARYGIVNVEGDLDGLSGRITDAFNSLDLTKSSGWSARVVPGTKQVWSEGSNRTRIEEWVRARLLIHTAFGPSLIGRMSPYLLIKTGCKDPEELFIKMEAHKPKKQMTNRWRLIWNPSLLDTLILYILHVRVNKASLQGFEDGTITHQVLGMGHHDEGVEKLGKIIDSLYDTGHPVSTSDASSWDFSVRRDGFFLDAYRRIATTTSKNHCEKDLFDSLLLVQASLQSAHVVAIGRELVEVHHFGILSSGILSTGEINSFLRTLYAFCSGAVATMACSDDLVAAGTMDMQSLGNFGIIDPAVEVVPQGLPISFTSHNFVKVDGRWIAIYDNVDKLFNGLLLKNTKLDGTLVYPGEEVAAGQRFALRHNKYASWLYKRLFETFGWRLPEADPYAIAPY